MRCREEGSAPCCLPVTLAILQTSTQEEIYEKSVSPLVEAALAGYNATVFAYGQTGLTCSLATARSTPPAALPSCG